MKFLTGESDIKNALIGKSNVVIYGMGEYGKKFFDLCSDYGIKVCSFIDGQCEGSYKGISARMPDELSNSSIFIICSRIHYSDMYNTLSVKGVSSENIYVFLPVESLYLEIKDYERILIEYEKRYVDTMRKTMPLPIIHFQVLFVGHCNLNCKGCKAFSPLSDEWFYDINTFKKDIRRMSEIFDCEAKRISLSGGEPLLHHDIVEAMQITREQFKSAMITIRTNGLLLPKMNESFWNSCRELDIRLLVTKYSINLNYEEIRDKAASYNVTIELHENLASVDMFLNKTLNLKGQCNPIESFLACADANRCITLSEGGKLYTCSTAAKIGAFKKYFKQSIVQSKRDYINIYSEINAKEVFEFLTKPIPMCRYCDVSNRYAWEWGVSRKEISEWT